MKLRISPRLVPVVATPYMLDTYFSSQKHKSNHKLNYQQKPHNLFIDFNKQQHIFFSSLIGKC